MRQGNKEEAPKLLRGFNLVRENGCFGCHEIAGIKSGREVGPDLRLEPAPALDWLSPTDQDKAKADPINPPGTYRKVGPSLRRIAEKTNEEWARRWIQSPRGFRPDTKMPHFYNLSNDSPDGPAGRPEGLPGGRDPLHRPLPVRGKPGRPEGRRHLPRRPGRPISRTCRTNSSTAPLDDKDRKELADATHKLADLGSAVGAAAAAKIDGAGRRPPRDAERLLERYPKQAELEQKIAELQARMVKLLDADLAEDGNEDAGLAQGHGRSEAGIHEAGRPIRRVGQEIPQTGIAPEELKELVGEPDKPGVKAKRDKAFKDLSDKATPVLQARLDNRQKAVTDQQKVLADRKKQVDDAKKASDALTKQVGEAQSA